MRTFAEIADRITMWDWAIWLRIRTRCDFSTWICWYCARRDWAWNKVIHYSAADTFGGPDTVAGVVKEEINFYTDHPVADPNNINAVY